MTRSLADWLALLCAELASSDDPRLQLTPAEERAVLDLARVAAHASERIAAPLTTFLAGIAMSGVSPAERAERIRALTNRLATAMQHRPDSTS